MFKGIIEYIKEKELILQKMNVNNGIGFNRVIDFLYFTDPEIFGLHGLARKDKNLHELMHNLQYRRLLKRAVVVSWDTIRDGHENKLKKYTKYASTYTVVDGMEYYRWLAKRIWIEAGKPGLMQELWVDCPKDLSFQEAENSWISPLGEKKESLRLSEYFLINKYAEQYKYKKWRSHVFCRPEHVKQVANASAKVFREEFDGLEFNPLAFELCHVEDPNVD